MGWAGCGLVVYKLLLRGLSGPFPSRPPLGVDGCHGVVPIVSDTFTGRGHRHVASIADAAPANAELPVWIGA
jgi:hypothetical protein